MTSHSLPVTHPAILATSFGLVLIRSESAGTARLCSLETILCINHQYYQSINHKDDEVKPILLFDGEIKSLLTSLQSVGIEIFDVL